MSSTTAVNARHRAAKSAPVAPLADTDATAPVAVRRSLPRRMLGWLVNGWCCSAWRASS